MKGTCLCGAIEVIAEPKNEVSLSLLNVSKMVEWGTSCRALWPRSHIKGAEPKRYQSSDWAVRGFAASVGRTCFTISCQPTNTSFLLAYSIILILS